MAIRPTVVGTVTSDDIVAIGREASTLVAAVREAYVAEEPGVPSLRRSYSQAQIASLCATSPQTVMRFVKEHEPVYGPTKVPNGAPRRFTANEMISIRAGLGKMQPPRLPRAITICFTNFKGGCSKSSLCATYGVGLALAGRRVLMVDQDPQGTLSAYMGLQPSLDLDAEATLLPYFALEKKDIRYALRKTRLANVDIVPAMYGLSHAEVTIPSYAYERKYPVHFWRILDRGLEALRSEYDFILIDSPPSLGYLTTISCYAADGLIVPLQPSMPDFASSAGFFEQAGSFFSSLDSVEETDAQKRYKFLRMAITRHSGKRGALKMEEQIRTTYGGLVLGPVMVESEAIRDAGTAHLTVHEIDGSLVHHATLSRAQESMVKLSEAMTEIALRTATVPAAVELEVEA